MPKGLSYDNVKSYGLRELILIYDLSAPPQRNLLNYPRVLQYFLQAVNGSNIRKGHAGRGFGYDFTNKYFFVYRKDIPCVIHPPVGAPPPYPRIVVQNDAKIASSYPSVSPAYAREAFFSSHEPPNKKQRTAGYGQSNGNSTIASDPSPAPAASSSSSSKSSQAQCIDIIVSLGEAAQQYIFAVNYMTAKRCDELCAEFQRAEVIDVRLLERLITPEEVARATPQPAQPFRP
jgi:hypothetical protein